MVLTAETWILAMHPRRPALALAALLVSVSAYAAPLTPSLVLYSANQYNGQSVNVEGIVTKLETKTTTTGIAYQTFQLCDASACLSVNAKYNKDYAEGADVKVNGYFWMTKIVGYKTYHNELDIDD